MLVCIPNLSLIVPDPPPDPPRRRERQIWDGVGARKWGERVEQGGGGERGAKAGWCGGGVRGDGARAGKVSFHQGDLAHQKCVEGRNAGKV